MKRAALLLFAAFAAGGRAAIVSDFSPTATGAPNLDGWKTLRVDPYTLTVTPGSLADPGWRSPGYLDATEVQGNDLFLYSAPAKFLGAKGDYFGGTVSFDESSDTTDHNGDPLVFFLVSADRSVALGYAVAPATPGYPGRHYADIPLRAAYGDWFRYVLDQNGNPTLDDATDADFHDVLANLGFMGINADYTTGVVDHTTLDNVVMSPVPEPAPLATLVLGLAALARRKRR